MEPYDVIVNQPVVIDNVRKIIILELTNQRLRFFLIKGSGVIKAGFAGDQIPKCRFPN